MKILFLGYKDCKLFNFLKEKYNIDYGEQANVNYDLIISFGYRKIIPTHVIDNTRIINLHISFLPYSRGAHPIFWSTVNNLQQGVTIHEIDYGIDTGPIVLQKKVNILEKNTLQEAHTLLTNEIQDLFINYASPIISGSLKAIPQEYDSKVRLHKKSDLPTGDRDWETNK